MSPVPDMVRRNADKRQLVRRPRGRILGMVALLPDFTPGTGRGNRSRRYGR